MSTTIDLNSDLGESYGRWTLGDDAAMVQYITSANLACGFHAGDFGVIDATVALCKQHGVGVGAQPSFPDLQGFGRRAMHLTSDEVEQCVLYQIGAVYAFCRGHGVELQHVKPHGALYNQAAANAQLARGIARAVARFSRQLPLVGLASSTAFREAAEDAGVCLVAEAFADRRYNPDGSLQSRSIAGSLVTDLDAAAEQAVHLVCDGFVVAHDGTRVQIDAQSVCFHGDTPGAPGIVSRARARLEGKGVSVRPIRELLKG
jgi:UPF0271 protein